MLSTTSAPNPAHPTVFLASNSAAAAQGIVESGTDLVDPILFLIDLYTVLNLAPGVSPAEIKAAYHRALLAAHPDKNNTAQSAPDIAAIKDTYRILSSPTLRAKSKADQDPLKSLRPVQVISLADFDEQGANTWAHACRCSSAYAITGAEMDRGVHLVLCTSCSEVVWVGYKLAEEDYANHPTTVATRAAQ
ncbi:hypothetical protein DFH08DRAFT_961478 [Mycena albidolilacea]|uniref:Diphthamide biosynthesis protein 4 n=1 Tax=Mycena albidolilacea TaxID=1033008 RepID=A0AAD7A0G8_9AGAR|nr:hypothetical protein DFH08DRAFT_961478 [Mycena albidolilacea]